MRKCIFFLLSMLVLFAIYFRKQPFINEPYQKNKLNAGCLIKNEGKLLAVRTIKSGKWDIPSGKSEANEAPHHTAERETLEETGLNVTAVRLLEIFDSDFYIYQCTINDDHFLSKKQKLSVPLNSVSEIAEIAFMDINDLTSNNTRFPIVLPSIKKQFSVIE